MRRYAIPCDACQHRQHIDRAHRLEVMVAGQVLHAWACSPACADIIREAYGSPLADADPLDTDPLQPLEGSTCGQLFERILARVSTRDWSPV